MFLRSTGFSLLISTALVALPVSAQAVAGECQSSCVIVERQSVPYPHADGRRPLTSDQINTTSTRLIDARRGYRPYPSWGHDCYTPRVAYRDTFGIIRPESYGHVYRKPATGVSTFYSTSVSPTPGLSSTPRTVPAEPIFLQAPLHVVVVDEREGAADAGAVAQAKQTEGVDMVVRIHRDKPEPVTEPGTAVLIRSDGTVIELR